VEAPTHPTDPSLQLLPPTSIVAEQTIASNRKKSRWSPEAATWDTLLLSCGSALLLYLLLQLVLFPYGRDQGIYHVVADNVHKGIAPYRGTWDFKPPGIFFVFALAQTLFGTSQVAIRLLEALGLVSLVGAFCILSRRFVGDIRPGLLGGVFAVLTHVQLEFWHTAQPESFGAMVLAWALVAATWHPRGPSAHHYYQHGAWALAGALYAAAALLKPPLGGGYVVSLGFALWKVHQSSSPLRWRRYVMPIVAFVIGGAVPVAATAAYFLAKGAWADLYETLFVFTPHYTKLGFRPEWLLGFIFLSVEQWVFAFSAFNVVGMMLLLALPPLASSERAGMAHVAGVVGFQLVGVALQAKFFPYHYGAALPFAGLLAGWGFWKLWSRARQHAVGLLGCVVMVVLLYDARTATRDTEESFWERCALRMQALRNPDLRTSLLDSLGSVADVNAHANRSVAMWLADHLPAGTPVYVWGFEPVIYALSGHPSASRYIYNVPQRVPWSRETSRPILLQELTAHPPSAIVVEHRDVFPVVTGDRLDSAAALAAFPELTNFLSTRYRLATSIEDFDVYVTESKL